MIRLVAMDLDGTLLGRDGKVSARNMLALRECEKRGVKMVIASGRGFESARIYARQAGLNSPIICANGARVEETPFGETILEDTIPEETSRRVCRIMLESGIYFVCYARGVNYNANTDEITRGMMRGQNMDGEKYTVRNVIAMEELLSEGVKRPYKYVAFAKEHQMGALEELKARLHEETDCACSRSWFDNVEAMAPGASKGRAVRFLAERYGIAKEEIMAFGDQMNDWEMMQEAGWPVAMENATDQLKGCARIIAPHHDCDGVGEILLREILKKQEDGEGK